MSVVIGHQLWAVSASKGGSPVFNAIVTVFLVIGFGVYIFLLFQRRGR